MIKEKNKTNESKTKKDFIQNFLNREIKNLNNLTS